MKELKRCLAEYAPAMLEAIGHGWGFQIRSAEIETDEEKTQVIEALAARMLSEKAVAEVLAALSVQEREALALVAQQGMIQAYRLVREYGNIQRHGPARLEREKPWLEPTSAAEHLWYLGLIYRGYGLVGDYHGEVYFIPPDLLGLLPRLEKPKPRFRLDTVSSPRSEWGDEIALGGDMATLLSYVRRAGVRIQKGAFLGRRDIAQLRERLAWSTEGYLDFLQHLARRAGLLRREGDTLRPSPKAREWLRAKPLERARSLYETWVEDRGWNDLWHIPTLLPQDTGWRNDPVETRRRVLSHVSRCTPSKWYEISAFVGAVKSFDPDFLRPGGDYDSWYIRDAETGRYLSGFGHWDRVEGALLRHMLSGPLHWLGAIRLGGEESGKATRFRLTALGAALLELPGTARPSLPERPLVVQPDLVIVAPWEANLYDRYQLERFAEWMAREDRVDYYRVTERSLWQSLQEGVEIGQIQAFLRRASGERVPQKVVRALSDWAAKFGQVKLARTALLLTQDEATMRALREAPLVRPYLGEAISPQASLVDEACWDDLVAALKRLGYWPQIEDLA